MEVPEISSREKLKSSLEEYPPTNCCICLTDKVDCYLPCYHYFHHYCLRRRFEIFENQCPLCNKRAETDHIIFLQE